MSLPSASAPAPRVPRILCADDEPAIREVLRILLRHEGFDVEVVGDGMDAWRRLSAAPKDFDLLITDNEMPLLSGVRLVQMLREAGNEMKIIVFSASIGPAGDDLFRTAQVAAMVPKGAPMDDLLREVHRIVQALR